VGRFASSDGVVILVLVKVVRAGWTSASFLAYAGALLALVAAFAWMGVISAEHSKGAFAGWTVVFYAVAEAIAFGLLVRGRRLTAGLFGFVSVGLFGVMVGAFFSWFGWLPEHENPFGGFHWGVLGLELLILLAALVAIRIFRFPLPVAIAAGLGWYLVTDVLSSGGNWSGWVTLLVGLTLFFVALGLDRGDSRPYGFWVHVVAGLTVGGALLHWWHSSDAQWALIIIVALVFIAIGVGLRRSSYAVIGAFGLVLATGYYSVSGYFGFIGSSFYGEPSGRPASWQVPVAYLCLGLFLVLLGMILHRRQAEAEST
jgi:hypothetical protein